MRLAVQLYTLRDRLDADVGATLRELAAAGARHVELAGAYGLSAQELREALDGAGLDAPSAHVPLERFETGITDAAVLGVKTLVVPSVPEDVDVARLGHAASLADAAGLGFAYHNHDFEFRSDLWDRIVATGRDHEPDVGWLRVAGRDPVSVLGQLSGRCPLVHAKDVRRAGDGWEDVPVGDGELDWPAIAAAARAAGSEWLVVELDHPSADPIDDVARSLRTLAPLV